LGEVARRKRRTRPEHGAMGAMLRPLEKLRRPRSPRELFVARITLLSLATLAIDLVASLAFYMMERDAPGTDVKTYEQALFWTTSQLTTVSSSLQNPITTGGHIVAVGIDLLAVGVVSALIGTVVHHLHLVSPRREAYFQDSSGTKSQSKNS
jgi:hypothetical protein